MLVDKRTPDTTGFNWISLQIRVNIAKQKVAFYNKRRLRRMKTAPSLLKGNRSILNFSEYVLKPNHLEINYKILFIISLFPIQEIFLPIHLNLGQLAIYTK